MTTVPPPDSRRDYDLLWLALAVLLFAGILVGTGIYVFSRYVVREVVTVRRDLRERSLKIHTPAGSMQASQGAPSPEELALPLYPGAKPTEREGASLSLQIPLQKNMSVVTAEFTTSDPFDKVVGYYRQQLGPSVSESRGKNEVRFSILSASKQKWVVVRRQDRQTLIALANMTEAQSQ